MITIVVPTFNRAAVLRVCLDSIISQYYEGLELIVIDDLSTDATRAYLDELTKLHNFVSIIYNATNKGVNYSRNMGIKSAKNKFILFLDSDDWLLPQSLDKIKNVIKANRHTTHFLFFVSDRGDDIKSTEATRNIQFKDWVAGIVGGDFTHVVVADIMRRYLFFEEFRMFEHLNWLRVKRETSPQLLVPLVVTGRNRDRTDSLTTSAKLINEQAIESKFKSQILYYTLYYTDLKKYNPASLTVKLIETILLGVACSQKKEGLMLLQYAGTRLTKIAGHLVLGLPSVLVKHLIVGYSSVK